MPDEFPLPLGPYLRGRVEHADGRATLTLAGECDLAAAEPTRALLTELEGSGARAIVMDVQALTFLDSSGVRVLLDAHKRSLGERTFAVLNGSGPAHRSLTLLGMDKVLTMVSSPDELDEELAPEGAGVSQ